VNLEESDALVGIVFLQMPTTRGWIIRLDADVLPPGHKPIERAQGDRAATIPDYLGEPIVKQCDIRILLGQTPEGADALARYFDLTPAERRSLIHARPGEGLLFVGRSHVAYEAVVSRREYAALTSRPSDLLDEEHQRYPPPDSA
jgi:hypothetical protein